ncbi:MAG: hypothetical protein JSW27_22675 [Phycisphaerales bacterium]|nr:MAG: hypothetical protein JSW27_22675 [Phycisphaerales bacterium]
MVREMLRVLALAAFLASTARGGEIKIHNWPSKFLSQEIPGCEIPVTMDVDVAPMCRILGTPVKLLPDDVVGTFKGCGQLLVQCTHGVTLRHSIVPTGVVQGTYSASLSPSDFDAPGGSADLCVTLTDAQPGGYAGRTNVQVATVKITVSSR